MRNVNILRISCCCFVLLIRLRKNVTINLWCIQLPVNVSFKMASDWNRGNCGLLSEDVIPVNDTAAFINDALVAAVNVPLCVFAFLSNLVAIVAVVKTPSLHKPCNILLCSLAFADCLSGAITQPLFVARRLMIHRAHISCDYQLELYVLHRCSFRLTTLLSFVNVVMSFDRHSALSKPLLYRANMTNIGKCLVI